MTVQFGRKLSVAIGPAGGTGLEFESFKVTFQVRRGDIQTPNSADVMIYNVKPQTANQISTKEFNELRIQAGYEGNFGLIFQGNVKQVRIGREDAVNTYVSITAADGDSAYNFAAIRRSFARGFQPRNAIEAFLSSMGNFGIKPGYVPELPQSGKFRGRVFYAMTRDELRDFSAAYNVQWSIQDKALTFIPRTGYIPGDPVIISPQTGLIEVPEQTQNGIETRVLLNPQLKIGKLVKLENTTINLLRYGLDTGSQANNQFLAQSVKTNAQGLYYVMSAEHSGDTRGDAWWTDLVLLAVDSAVPLSAVTRATVADEDAAVRLD